MFSFLIQRFIYYSYAYRFLYHRAISCTTSSWNPSICYWLSQEPIALDKLSWRIPAYICWVAIYRTSTSSDGVAAHVRLMSMSWGRLITDPSLTSTDQGSLRTAVPLRSDGRSHHHDISPRLFNLPPRRHRCVIQFRRRKGKIMGCYWCKLGYQTWLRAPGVVGREAGFLWPRVLALCPLPKWDSGFGRREGGVMGLWVGWLLEEPAPRTPNGQSPLSDHNQVSPTAVALNSTCQSAQVPSSRFWAPSGHPNLAPTRLH